MKCIKCNNADCEIGSPELECTTAYVLHTHESLKELNPSLGSVAPVNAEYDCFRLNSSIVVNTGHNIPILEFGCTFRQTKFCEGWDDDVLVHECQLCPTDRCNGNASASNSTAGVDGKIRIGTELVIGGLCLILLFL